MRFCGPSILVAAILASSSGWAADCPMDLGHGTGWVVFSEHHMIAFRSDPMQVEVGEPVSLLMNVCTKSGEAAELVSVGVQFVGDVKVPSQHLSLSGGAQGRYRAEGLSFSEPGAWEIDFNVRSSGENEELTHELIVK
jgi:hypothetical protein